MINKQEEAFWEAIKILKELEILEHVMIIGSWAEKLFPPLFETDFEPNISTRDVDFFYRNINMPRQEVPLIKRFAENGFIYTEDPFSGVSKFYKEGLLELEFLTKVMGSGVENSYNIRALGIKSEGLRAINILSEYAFVVEKNGFRITVPEPAVYVIQKILTNPNRVPKEKKQKDIRAIEELLIHINQSEYHVNKMIEIYNKLNKKQLAILEKVTAKNFIKLFE